MRLFDFFRPQPPIPTDWLDQPEFRRMSRRELADLPMPRPVPASAPVPAPAPRRD